MILAVLAILGGALLLAIIFKEKLEHTIPAFMLLTIVMLYMSGLLFNLTVGFVLLVVLAILGIGLTIYRAIRNETRSDTLGLLLNVPVTMFVILCIFIFVINMTRQFGHWDEFSHWGPMIRETLRLNDFHNQVGSALYVHRDYPPGIALFQYFFLRLAGGFSEQGAFRALQLLTLSLMLPVFSRIRSKLVVGCVFAILLFLPDALGISTYASIYTDTVLGVLLGYLIFLVTTKVGSKVFYLLNVFLVSMTIILTKQIGLVLLLIPVMLLLMEWLIQLIGRKKDSQSNRKELFTPLKSVGVIFLGAILGQVTWSGRLSRVNVPEGQFSVGDILNGTFELLSGNLQPHQLEVLRNYAGAIFARGLVPMFGLPFFSVFILLTIGAIVLYLSPRRQGEVRRLLPLAIGTPLGMGLYVLVMLIMYMVAFCEFEGVRLASFERYMGTVLIGFGVGLFLVCMDNLGEIRKSELKLQIKFLLFTGAFLALAISGNTYHQVFVSGIEPRGNLEQEFQSRHAILFDRVNLEEDRVYLIMQGSTGIEYWRTRFYANPLQTNEIFTWSIGSAVSDEDLWTRPMSAEEWSEKLLTGEFDYVYLYGVNEVFTGEFRTLFYDLSDVRNGVLLRVTEEDGRAVLRREF